MTEHSTGSGDASTRNANGHARDSHVTDDLVAAYVDEELDSRSARRIERHLAGCASCRAAVRVQRGVRVRLRQEPAPGVPFALRDRAFAAIRSTPVPDRAGFRKRAPARRRPAGWLAGFLWHPAWAAAAVLVVAALGYAAVRSGLTREPVDRDRADALGLETSDSAAIVQLILGHAAAWNNRDARAAAVLLTPDATWVTSTGVELRGREAIELAHSEWFSQDSATGGTTHIHPPGTISVRFLRPDVAVADLEGQFLLPAADEEQPTVVEEARIFVVATRDAEGWRIAQLRNMRRRDAGVTPR